MMAWPDCNCLQNLARIFSPLENLPQLITGPWLSPQCVSPSPVLLTRQDLEDVQSANDPNQPVPMGHEKPMKPVF